MDEAKTMPLWKRIADFPLVALVLAVLVFMLTMSASLLLAKPIPDPTGNDQIVFKLIYCVLLVFVAKLVLSKLGEHPRDDLRINGGLRNLALGLGYGAGIMGLVVAIAAALGLYSIAGPGDTIKLFPEIVALGLFPAISEEIFFRGILFRWCEELGGSWFALALTSAFFGLAHLMNPNATAFSSFAIAVEAGILLGGAYMLTRSLWMPMGLHAAWNITQGEIFDVPVSGLAMNGLVNARIQGPELLSGGQFGFEASIIALVLATAAGVWLVVRAIRQGELVRPWWVRRRLASEEAVRVDVDRDADLGAPVESA
ncbi:MAG TPA: type II CAAX endopeptidase family protein [Sphingomicrobium sp.]|nr:type II CAAX endopeptidase family protein [Sphingomicrobium sp.]